METENKIKENKIKFEKIEAFLLHCSTGCSCCSDENHKRGPYRSEADANKRKHFFLHGKGFYPLGSRYAKRGIYTVERAEIELLGDGRAIINGWQVISFKFVDVAEDGSGADYDCIADLD